MIHAFPAFVVSSFFLVRHLPMLVICRPFSQQVRTASVADLPIADFTLRIAEDLPWCFSICNLNLQSGKARPLRQAVLTTHPEQKGSPIMHEEYASVITALPLFKGYTPQGAQRLISKGEVKECAADDVLFEEGDEASGVLLVLKGKLQVFVSRHGKQLVLTDAGPGSILGELAVLCGIPRSASVRVVEPSTVLQWDANSFRGLLMADAFLSERIFRQSLRSLIDKEQSLIASLTEPKDSAN